MTIYRHRKIAAEPDTVPVTGTTTLSCEVYSSDPTTSVSITYSLDPAHRHWFSLSGTRVKRFTDHDVPVAAVPTRIVRRVTLVERPEGTSPLFFYITANIVEDGSGSRVRTATAITVT